MTTGAVVITGVSTGIGLGCARAFVSRGYRVYGSVRKAEDGERVAAELGDGFRPVVFDITDEDAVVDAARWVERDLGGLPLLGVVNNAGIATSGPLMIQPLDEIRQQFEVNVIGQLVVTRAFLPLLQAAPSARIMMMSSVGGKVSGPFLGAYSASKHALEGMSDALRRELMLFDIDVIVIGPGTVASAIWDKPSANDVDGVVGTPYEASAKAMQVFAVTRGKNGESIDRFGRMVLGAFEARRPKARYAFVKGKLKNWILPRVLPPRWVDRIIGKRFGLSAS
ncbi:MAG: SDR family oxidoreductase [Deltaproteobacteria bacterium]|nr:SDR family oxidoreductase [Deltaproteobacteria bacterium]